jgi:hypothetical protein
MVGVIYTDDRFYFLFCRDPMPETQPAFGGTATSDYGSIVTNLVVPFGHPSPNFELHRAFLTDFYIHLFSPVSVALTFGV